MATWSDLRGLTGSQPQADPFHVLGVSPTVSDAELRRAYHRLAHLYHPDHNDGSDAAAERFAAVQRAYDEALARRSIDRRPAAVAAYTTALAAASEMTALVPIGNDDVDSEGPRRAWAEPWLDARIAAFERSLESSRLAQEQAYESVGRVTSDARTRDVTSPTVERRRSRQPLGEWFADGR